MSEPRSTYDEFSATPFSRSLFMSECPTFTGLPEDVIKSLEPHLFEQEFSVGEFLIRQGDDGTSLIVLTSGIVEVYTEDEFGQRNVIDRSSRGEIIGILQCKLFEDFHQGFVVFRFQIGHR